MQIGLGGIGAFIVVFGAMLVSAFRDRSCPNETGPDHPSHATDPSGGAGPQTLPPF